MCQRGISENFKEITFAEATMSTPRPHDRSVCSECETGKSILFEITTEWGKQRKEGFTRVRPEF